MGLVVTPLGKIVITYKPRIVVDKKYCEFIHKGFEINCRDIIRYKNIYNKLVYNALKGDVDEGILLSDGFDGEKSTPNTTKVFSSDSKEGQEILDHIIELKSLTHAFTQH